ncbi:DUF72 domain-containing protein [Aestuariivirga sp.]|uniref:DUF72 domain-containing protein n=1 Tax=Aestuariivirga sp. TaxID=2650926 RepID=UPI0039E483DF
MSFIGTAGWAVPAQYRDRFPAGGSHLERYATRLTCVEINSSFYRSHKRSTYEKWAVSVPEGFRFSVKVPRRITQEHRLKNYNGELDRFLGEVIGLGHRLGVLLTQLPPSLAYDSEAAEMFFRDIARAKATVACEPRHPSWFTPEAEEHLKALKVSRVAADPPRASTDGTPGGDTGLAYYRLHGSPKIYYSAYSDADLKRLVPELRPGDWCIFDNTAAFHALGDALRLQEINRV